MKKLRVYFSITKNTNDIIKYIRAVESLAPLGWILTQDFTLDCMKNYRDKTDCFQEFFLHNLNKLGREFWLELTEKTQEKSFIEIPHFTKENYEDLKELIENIFIDSDDRLGLGIEYHLEFEEYEVQEEKIDNVSGGGQWKLD